MTQQNKVLEKIARSKEGKDWTLIGVARGDSLLGIIYTYRVSWNKKSPSTTFLEDDWVYFIILIGHPGCDENNFDMWCSLFSLWQHHCLQWLIACAIFLCFNFSPERFTSCVLLQAPHISWRFIMGTVLVFRQYLYRRSLDVTNKFINLVNIPPRAHLWYNDWFIT